MEEYELPMEYNETYVINVKRSALYDGAFHFSKMLIFWVKGVGNHPQHV